MFRGEGEVAAVTSLSCAPVTSPIIMLIGLSFARCNGSSKLSDLLAIDFSLPSVALKSLVLAKFSYESLSSAPPTPIKILSRLLLDSPKP